MDGNTWIHDVSAKRFLNHCKDKFKWTDLSSDVIMDVGCGVSGVVGKALLHMFPRVGTIIGITKDPNEVENLKAGYTKKIEYEVADIEKRETLQKYEGQMTKVISAHVFQYIVDKEEAARNIYHLLKPGGEAAVLFMVRSMLYDWLTEMLLIPRWNYCYKGRYTEDLYAKEFGTAEKDAILKMGFQEVECVEQIREIHYATDQECKEALYRLYGKYFTLPPELLEKFKADSFHELLKQNGRDNEGRPCFRFKEATLLLAKPADVSTSEK